MASENNKRIAKNTLMLYFRQVLILFVSLYTVRIVLNTLGVEDYGIYSVIGGIVSFFSFLSGTMASATQRFFSFSIGQRDFNRLKKTFSVNLLIYLAIAMIALVLLETVGLWFINEQLQVPTERMEAARLIYHFSVFMFIATIFSTPFMAIIIAHEDMQVYAYVSIVEAVMKLSVVFILVHLTLDKLELYGILTFAVSVIITLVYIFICLKKYTECQFRKFYWDKKLLHEIIGFTGWTLFGQLTTVVRNQAITILLNQVFSPVVVAARAIAINITNQINVFSNNFNTGLYPPIIKYYAIGNKKELFSLIFNGSKISFFLMWVFALPFYVEMGMILTLWLKNPPPEAILFTRLALIETVLTTISLPLVTAARAPGKMRIYELTLGSIQIAIFIVSWLVLKQGGAAYTVFVVAIIASIIMFIVRLLLVRKIIRLPLFSFLKQVLSPIFLIALMTVFCSFIIHFYLPSGLLFSCLCILLNVFIIIICVYFIGIDKSTRTKINDVIANKIIKKFS